MFPIIFQDYKVFYNREADGYNLKKIHWGKDITSFDTILLVIQYKKYVQ